jgi:hypothetical protein
MPKKRTEKGAPQPMRKVTLYLPEEIARELKVRAAENFTSLGKLVVALVEQSRKGGEAKKK